MALMTFERLSTDLSEYALESTFDRLPTGIGDTQTLNCERPAVHSQHLSHHLCEPSERKLCQRLTREAMADHKHILGCPARRAGEQLERLARLRLKIKFLP
jgi:hypothetical protein